MEQYPAEKPHVFVPVEPERQYSDMTYEEQIQYTQNTKQRILHQLAFSNPVGTIPTDKESVDTMLKVMDSMDRTAIANKRISVDQEANRTSADLLAGMAAFIQNAKNKNPFVATEGDGRGMEPQIDQEDLGEFTHAEGEDEIGVIAETSEEFTERMEAIREKARKEEEALLGF
ncbi:hypothetical protein AVT69_gp196 [Pseudomonas phage PhiPA3]|uniref:Uncharacterized protein 198 n=1 Tax=Pseudomonas phage PhiPA3 TaxID=998086 RepID=F8SJ41_BPPA3|nr:hypothetical protein AVT69_gp196 [Pseudomonas phage PhiPA3]AEH03621.1 hypothetical protein [Pseudomonas phage PhiPA3]